MEEINPVTIKVEGLVKIPEWMLTMEGVVRWNVINREIEMMDKEVMGEDGMDE